MPGRSDAEIIARVVAEKMAAEMLEDTAIALALDFMGGCGVASATYAAVKATQQAAAIVKLSKWIYDRYGKKNVRISRKMVEEAWDACM